MTVSRSGILIAAGLLAACGSESGSVPVAAETAAGQDGPETIACAVGGAKDFAKSCEVERSQAEDALFLTVRHADGGFRRFKVLEDGRGLEPADGAEGARLRMNGEWLEVVIGKDRYRFPATRTENAVEP